MHLAALLVLLWVEIPPGAGLLLAIPVAISLVWVMRQQALRLTASAITAVEVSGSGNLILHPRAGEPLHVTRVLSAFVHPAVIALALRIDGRRLPLNFILPWDAVDTEHFRQLRVQLNRMC